MVVLAARHLAVAAAAGAPAPWLPALLYAASLMLLLQALLAYRCYRRAAPRAPGLALAGALYVLALAASSAALASAAPRGGAVAAVVLDYAWLGVSLARAMAYWPLGGSVRDAALLSAVSGAPGPGPKLLAPLGCAALAAALSRPRR